MSVENNLSEILHRIETAARRANRRPEDIQLIGVTKTVDIPIMEEAIALGVTHVGENKVQELTRKYEKIGGKVKWHLIGHLQRNKVKYIIDKVDLIHSLDSYELAVEIDKRAKQHNRNISCLLQINISGEETKYGINSKDAVFLLNKIQLLPNIKILGLMTMAPHVEDPENTRQYFRGMKELFDQLSTLNMNNVEMKYLSMGMSNDFEVAIEEGAHFVRVGSAIFGARNYDK